MKYLPAFVAAGVLAAVLGVIGAFSLTAALTPSAEKVSAEISQPAGQEPPLYGAR